MSKSCYYFSILLKFEMLVGSIISVFIGFYLGLLASSYFETAEDFYTILSRLGIMALPLVITSFFGILLPYFSLKELRKFSIKNRFWINIILLMECLIISLLPGIGLLFTPFVWLHIVLFLLCFFPKKIALLIAENDIK